MQEKKKKKKKVEANRLDVQIYIMHPHLILTHTYSEDYLNLTRWSHKMTISKDDDLIRWRSHKNKMMSEDLICARVKSRDEDMFLWDAIGLQICSLHMTTTHIMPPDCSTYDSRCYDHATVCSEFARSCPLHDVHLFAWSLMLSRGTSEGRDDGKRTHRTYGGCPKFVTFAKAVCSTRCVYSHCSCGLDCHGVSSCWFRRWQIRLWLAASVDLHLMHLIVGLTVTLLIVHGASFIIWNSLFLLRALQQ